MRAKTIAARTSVMPRLCMARLFSGEAVSEPSAAFSASCGVSGGVSCSLEGSSMTYIIGVSLSHGLDAPDRRSSLNTASS